MLLLLIIFSIGLQMILINLIVDKKKLMYPLILGTIFLTNIGVITMERRLKGSASQILSQIFEDYKGITIFVMMYLRRSHFHWLYCELWAHYDT